MARTTQTFIPNSYQPTFPTSHHTPTISQPQEPLGTHQTKQPKWSTSSPPQPPPHPQKSTSAKTKQKVHPPIPSHPIPSPRFSSHQTQKLTPALTDEELIKYGWDQDIWQAYPPPKPPAAPPPPPLTKTTQVPRRQPLLSTHLPPSPGCGSIMGFPPRSAVRGLRAVDKGEFY